MYKNRAPTGKANLCGLRNKSLRTSLKPKCSQRILAEKLQLLGIDVDKYAIQRIERGSRFVTDIELKALAQVFGVTTDDLLSE